MTAIDQEVHELRHGEPQVAPRVRCGRYSRAGTRRDSGPRYSGARSTLLPPIIKLYNAFEPGERGGLPPPRGQVRPVRDCTFPSPGDRCRTLSWELSRGPG